MTLNVRVAKPLALATILLILVLCNAAPASAQVLPLPPNEPRPCQPYPLCLVVPDPRVLQPTPPSLDRPDPDRPTLPLQDDPGHAAHLKGMFTVDDGHGRDLRNYDLFANLPWLATNPMPTIWLWLANMGFAVGKYALGFAVWFTEWSMTAGVVDWIKAPAQDLEKIWQTTIIGGLKLRELALLIATGYLGLLFTRGLTTRAWRETVSTIAINVMAIAIVSPFTGADIDADFIIAVANRAKDIGDTQVKAAQAAAIDAAAQAQRAADAARDAAADVAPAYQAAAAAASSAADAARSAAAAQQSAAEAAIHGAAARKAAADADAVDASAQADAQAARAAANQAAADAALAGRLADQAEADARAARKAANDATTAANEASAAATRAEHDAAAAREAAAQAQRDADAARASADRAAQHARDADQAATNAENYAKDTQARADNVGQVARDIQAELAQIQEQLRLEDEQRQREQAEEAITDDSEVPALTAEEVELLRTEQGQAGVDQYNLARADSNKPLLDFIVAEGGQIILDIVGYNDAKKCFTEGDFIACVMTVINALPILKIASVLSKIPDAVSAVVRIVKGIRTFKDLKIAGRRIANNLRDVIRQLRNCHSVASDGFAAGKPCKVLDKEEELKRVEPRVDPEPGPRLDPAKDKKRVDDCGNGTIPADQPVNDPLEPFTYLGDPALRARGGITCVTKSIQNTGTRATPVGFDGSTMQRGHLIAARFSGSNSLINIVNQYKRVNNPDVKVVENSIGRALATNKGIIYRVWVQYPSGMAPLPQWIFIDAIGNNGYRCYATIENIVGGGAVSKSGCY
ncbi:DNA/RNA non-specific endonuclease [Amycolatopsis sp. BJA-103]|uniref:DNA/RNA non-specific endonuclease n=1 Tax=Amycolatopsis sp. BJA-103 TaxID=1911175 RepID=UPI000C789FC8|nr:DNA/RNA non-specific endonuclease [Amycolatopsis sp. BJA-103]AUI60424.1 hypothetical protein BKN51_20990 [Amycolatopsis sp. BJA-103]PNE16449.1 hypothetical protein B1H26_24630 [Amycolatopsis sp. BJA-103]